MTSVSEDRVAGGVAEMFNVLIRSLTIAFGFSLAILLILGVSELNDSLWFGHYFFVFAVVAYGMMEKLHIAQGPSHLPVIVAWLLLLPGMTVFYTPVVALFVLWHRERRMARSARPN